MGDKDITSKRTNEHTVEFWRLREFSFELGVISKFLSDVEILASDIATSSK